MRHTRPVTVEDAEELLALAEANRSFLAPWQPTAPATAFTLTFQRSQLSRMVEARAGGLGDARVVLDGERIIGRITLSDIIRGAFESCHLGYWIAEAENGRGHASAAVAEMCAIAFGDLGLHRVQAGTLVHNAASQRVLERNGFTRFGLAPRYLKIAGIWQDHVLYQRLGEIASPDR